ncbi:prepilin peptidase [Desulfobacterales bacterium HSG16]|nr:prepilin peptidase [Desulfobacterales bacterium HSG16]
MMPLIIFSFIFGLCIGSFLNVCIFRIPAQKSIVHPGSMCLKCGYQIRFYDNIPVLSYAILQGKCRQCKTPISIRYPLVEIMTGLFAVCAFLRFGPTAEAAIYFFFIAVLIVITYIDIDHQIIPDVISLPGIIIFFIAAMAIPSVSMKDSVFGLLLGGGTLFAIAWLYSTLTGKDGMGGGDIKLLAMMGPIIGWKGVFFTIFVSSAVGTIAGLLMMIATRKDMKLKIPYGPFLSIGAITYIFFGEQIIFWYFQFLR